MEEKRSEQQNYFRQKYDKEYDFKALNKKAEQKKDYLEDVQLPQNILEIRDLVN